MFNMKLLSMCPQFHLEFCSFKNPFSNLFYECFHTQVVKGFFFIKSVYDFYTWNESKAHKALLFVHRKLLLLSMQEVKGVVPIAVPKVWCSFTSLDQYFFNVNDKGLTKLKFFKTTEMRIKVQWHPVFDVTENCSVANYNYQMFVCSKSKIGCSSWST